MGVIRLSHHTGEFDGTIKLDGSKSISNRILIIRALCKEDFKINNISTSDDSSKLSTLLKQKDSNIYDVGHAGTTFRFLTAYLALQPGTQFLTGSDRMLERPIGPLVEALRSIGCKIEYKGNEGYPPLSIRECNPTDLSDSVVINSGMSSQYITALMLIAPTLPNGMRIELKGNMVSESYLKLTIGIIEEFGIDVKYENSIIEIRPQDYKPREYTVEADWSASSYHYALVALAKKGGIKLEGLFQDSLQGDAAMTRIGGLVGVESNWKNDVLHLSKGTAYSKFNYNFINQPDVAQTLGVICAGGGIKNDFTGLITLKIKETDRISAMNTELQKIGSSFKLDRIDENGVEHYSVKPGLDFSSGVPRFETYKDHRMAMAFAPLALLRPIEINNPNVVTKSYPGFYKDLESLGFVIEEIS